MPGTEDDNESFQGADRLADVMAGDEFGFMLIARPYTEEAIAKLEGDIFHLANSLSPLAHRSWQITESYGKQKLHIDG